MARRKLRIDMVAEVEPVLTEPQPGDGAMRGVGATLRAARERRGWSIADVAQQLRIRAPVLEAMEAGHFEKLPNGAYALGFVRSYADFLGLDRDEIAQRVKAEAAALNARTELVFPKPISEGRMPSAVVLAVSLALAVGGYGLWYYHSANGRLEPSRVDAVPARLAAQLEPKPSPRDAAAATVAEPPAMPGDTSAQSAAGATASASTPAAPSDAGAASATMSAAAPAASSPVNAPASAAPTTAPAAAAAPSAPASTAPVESAPQVAAVPAGPAPGATAPSAGDTKPAPAAKQYGEANGARIVLKATADSWVQVRDHGGAIIFSRILRAGDSYAVPNRPGLVMATGSAGALDIVVDGKDAPAIGRVGFTQKNVQLDPERLLAGTAAVENSHARSAAKPAAHGTTPSAPAGETPAPAAPSASGSNG